MPLERCPVCGVKVKSENLSRHIKKVHPDAEADAEKKTKKAKRPSPGGRKAIYAVVAVIIIVVLVASAFVLLPAAEEPEIGVTPSSPEFIGPEPQVSWNGETLLPGQNGYLDVTYDPTVFSDSGSVARAVYIQSNDPNRSEVQITITAYVTP